MDEFLFCYKPIEISKSLGVFQFSPGIELLSLSHYCPCLIESGSQSFSFIYGFWIGNPIEVGRDAFPSLDDVWGHPHPAGLHFFFSCICIHIIFLSDMLFCSFPALVRLVLDDFFEDRVHRASIFMKRDFHSLVTLHCLAHWGLGPEPNEVALGYKATTQRSKYFIISSNFALSCSLVRLICYLTCQGWRP